LKAESQAYEAFAYSSDSGSEVVAGKVSLGPFRLRFESESGLIEIPLVRLQIEMGGPTDGRVYFTHMDQPGWTIYTFDESILKHPALRQQAHTRNQIEAIQSSGELKRRLKLTLAVVGGFAFLALVVSLLSGIMVRSLLKNIPVEWEIELGTNLLAELRQEEDFNEDPKWAGQLERAVAPLMAVLGQGKIPYHFYVLDDELPNAFALPGGHVLVTRGLLELADHPEEIAAVVAHEIAHVTQKHGFRKILSAAGPYLLVKTFVRSESGLAGVLGDSSQLLVRQSFSQKYELEADAVGWDYLVRAGLDPRALPRMLQKLQQAQDSRGPDLQWKAFSSHPETEKRIRRLEEKWRQLQKQGWQPRPMP